MNVFDKLRSGKYVANPALDELEQKVLTALINNQDGSPMKVYSNKEIAEAVGSSRNQVAKARKHLAEKIDIVPRGF